MATMKENITNALSWFYDKLKKNDLEPMQEDISQLNSDLTQVNSELKTLDSEKIDSSCFSLQTFTSSSVTVDSGSSGTVSISVARSGYTPIAAWQRTAGVARLTNYGVYLSGTTVTILMVNLGTTSATGTYTVQVLFVKDSV